MQDKNKSYFGVRMEGTFVKYQGYEDALEKEAAFLLDLLASHEEKECMRRAATYDSWAADYCNAHEQRTTPTRNTASGSAMPSGLSGAPSKVPRTSSPDPIQLAPENDSDADEEAARDLHFSDSAD